MQSYELIWEKVTMIVLLTIIYFVFLSIGVHFLKYCTPISGYATCYHPGF